MGRIRRLENFRSYGLGSGGGALLIGQGRTRGSAGLTRTWNSNRLSAPSGCNASFSRFASQSLLGLTFTTCPIRRHAHNYSSYPEALTREFRAFLGPLYTPLKYNRSARFSFLPSSLAVTMPSSPFGYTSYYLPLLITTSTHRILTKFLSPSPGLPDVAAGIIHVPLHAAPSVTIHPDDPALALYPPTTHTNNKPNMFLTTSPYRLTILRPHQMDRTPLVHHQLSIRLSRLTGTASAQLLLPRVMTVVRKLGRMMIRTWPAVQIEKEELKAKPTRGSRLVRFSQRFHLDIISLSAHVLFAVASR
ncbi:hypothetical protein IMY05_C4480000700 [Salix suchowensis]|nr:hypothetical protein IMY05_C4480000700 [Salix suchowensis]